ncbi:DUF3157 family protein [uncultured Shewanella sp.]|uniref:DUF3157 family protein n=1 Tax=uncultured Shewanella sp. TaxID=173975 RepID=UPI002617DE02|nr:DUF3157 family protein [uncultured Shewanella sp.]
MHKLKQITRILITTTIAYLLTLTSAFAAQIAEITLDNGAKVKLNDDFTWEYVILNKPNETVQKSTQTIDTKSVKAPPQSALSTPQLNQQFITQSELLKSTAKDGVKVSILKTKWDDDKLGLQFELTSDSNKHYVLVKLETQFYNDEGQQIKSDNLNVWQATFRLPDTYLRKNETRESRTFWIDGINKAHWKKELMSLKITELESR